MLNMNKLKNLLFLHSRHRFVDLEGSDNFATLPIISETQRQNTHSSYNANMKCKGFMVFKATKNIIKSLETETCNDKIIIISREAEINTSISGLEKTSTKAFAVTFRYKQFKKSSKKSE